MHRGYERRSLVQVDYRGEVPSHLREFLAVDSERPITLKLRPLVLVVRDADGFVPRLHSAVARSGLKASGIFLRRGAYVVRRGANAAVAAAF